MNGPPFFRAATIASTALKPTPLIAAEPEMRSSPRAATWNVDSPSLMFGGKDLDPHPPAIVDMFDEILLALRAVHLRREQARP